MRVILAAVSAAVLLSACAPTRTASVAPQVTAAQPAENYVWARNDGRRMAENPDLLRQGRADQAACSASASTAGALNPAAFASCMEARGYSRRRA
jgi:hypothetical protein